MKFEFNIEQREEMLSLWMEKFIDEDGEEFVRLKSKNISKPNAQEYTEAIIYNDHTIVLIPCGNLKGSDTFDVLYRCDNCISSCNYGYNFINKHDDVNRYAEPRGCVCNPLMRPDWKRVY